MNLIVVETLIAIFYSIFAGIFVKCYRDTKEENCMLGVVVFAGVGIWMLVRIFLKIF